MRKIYLILIIICPILFFSQSIEGFKVPDSLKNKDIKYIENLYNHVFQVDNEKAEFYANIILTEGKKNNSLDLIFDGYYNVARVKNLKNENGHPFADSLIALTKNINHYDYPAKSYILKGILYNNEGRYKEALNEYSHALKLNKVENKDQEFYIKKLIAILKTATEEYKEALPLFLEHYEYEKLRINTESKDSKTYIASIFSLANIYAMSNDYKKSIQFAELGLLECKKYNNYSNYNYLLMIKGISLFYLKNYKISYKILSEVEKGLIKNSDFANLGILYYYFGKIEYENNRKENAIKYFKKADSISFGFNSFEPIKRQGYEILIDYYKNKGDIKTQLKYINKLIYTDSVIASNRKNLSKEILKKYDTPILMKEREGLIEKLNYKNTFYIWLVIFLLLTVLLFIYIINENRKKIKKYEKYAKTLLLESPSVISKIHKDENRENNNVSTIKTNEKNIKSELLSNPIFKELIEKIKLFENNNEYLSKNITLDSLSKEFDTNRDYLSKLINETKGKNFSQYLNELRINYIVEELKSNKKIRKHTIAAIAEDIGYNNSESFTNAFKKITGTLPSYFIKALNEKDTIN